MKNDVKDDMKLGDIMDMERAELFKKLVDACVEYGEGSEQHQEASDAFRTGVETYIGELYERADRSLRKNNSQIMREYEEFFSRVPRLLQVIKRKEFHFFAGPDSSFTITATGEVRKLKVESA